LVQGKRADVPSVAILITDGQSSTSSLSTVAEAITAQQAGIKIFTIGISTLVNMTELQLISSSPRLYYHQWWNASNFAGLSPLEPVVAQALCRPDYGTPLYYCIDSICAKIQLAIIIIFPGDFTFSFSVARKQGSSPGSAYDLVVPAQA